MSVRRTLTGVLAGSLTAATLWAGAAPGHAVVTPGPYDSTFAPTAADLIGVGSDTSQQTVFDVAQAFNGQTPAPTFRVATYGAAVQDGKALAGCEAPVQASTCEIELPQVGKTARPNGSGAGKSRLHGAGNMPIIDFARSSSPLNATETAAGLQAIPFAVDVMQMVVSNNVQSNAPTTITPQQIVDIYKGVITNWNEINPNRTGTIVPIKPQASSGTFSFFDGELKAINDGNAITYGPNVIEAQEHDDALIKNNANAIAPFSVGRAGLLGSTLRLLDGWSPKRALYNVVRGADLADPKIQAVFGSQGFFCSDEATDLIVETGFDQMARPVDGGVCGAQTQSASTNFTINAPAEPIDTTVAVTGTSPGARKVKLTATVTANPTAEGTVTFTETTIENVVADEIPVIGGVATANLSGVAPGVHTYTAEFVPAEGTHFVGSVDETPVKVTVKTTAALKETFPATLKKGARAKGTVTVTLTGVSAKATGKVVVKRGSKTVGSGALKGGKVSLTLAKLPKGKNKLVVSWAGNKVAAAAKKSFTITQK